jgi:tRNA(Ile)-lysidine synthase
MNKKNSGKEHLLRDFHAHVQEHGLISKTDKLLLAVSGGIDSVALFHLFRLKGYKFSVAHCNFKLRGKQSDNDEKFVKDLCEHHSINCYTTSFDTKKFAKANVISIQMAARDLRYSWFNQLLVTHGFDKLCTAHHLNDSVETVLSNLSRETGINGLTGIKAVNGKVIRPLLFCTKKQIKEFVKLHGFDFRKDKSNDDVKYKRNLIRKKIVPLFEKLNPSFAESMFSSMEHFSEAQKVIDATIKEASKSIIKKEAAGSFIIDLTALNKFASPTLFLHQFLTAKGFDQASAFKATSLLTAQTGKHVLFNDLELLKDRNRLILSGITKGNEKLVVVEKPGQHIYTPVELTFEKALLESVPKTGKDIILAPINEINFPLIVRQWSPGDHIIPFGMKGKKKVSDILIDAKVPRNKKNKVRVLENGDGRIIWVIGIRFDNRFRIVERGPSEVLVVKLHNASYL